MDKDLEIFLNNFKEHLQQLILCETKVKSGEALIVKTQGLYEKNLLALEAIINKELAAFLKNLDSVSADDIAAAATRVALIRDEFNFFVNTYEVLSTGEDALKKELRTNISRLNLLLEATIKLKMFIEDRWVKIQTKYNNADLTEFKKVFDASVKIADKINYSVSVLNARITFMFAKEMEISSKFQTFEATLNELKKRFKNLS